MSTVTDLESYQQFAQEQQVANNAWSAQQAQKQMDFQREMSNSAHQREVADLKAAGLNPILSVNSGASVPNGAQGETDTSAAGNVGAILQQVLQAQSAREVAGMYNAATIAAAQIAAGASMYGSDMSYANTHDHPNSIESVIARSLVQLGLNGGQAGSGGNGSSLFDMLLNTAAGAVTDSGLAKSNNTANSGKQYNAVQQVLYNWGQKAAAKNSNVDPNLKIWREQVLPNLRSRGLNTSNNTLMKFWYNIWRTNPKGFNILISAATKHRGKY